MNRPTNLAVYYFDRISHYVVAMHVTPGFVLYLMMAERLVDFDVPFDLVWTTMLKDAKHYSESDALAVVDHITSEGTWWENSNRLTEDKPNHIESCGQRIKRLNCAQSN